jgi:hypothetical protein
MGGIGLPSDAIASGLFGTAESNVRVDAWLHIEPILPLSGKYATTF